MFVGSLIAYGVSFVLLFSFIGSSLSHVFGSRDKNGVANAFDVDKNGKLKVQRSMGLLESGAKVMIHTKNNVIKMNENLTDNPKEIGVVN